MKPERIHASRNPNGPILARAMSAVLPFPACVARWVRFTDKTAGRDKLCRVVQYFCKFYLAHLQMTGADPVLVGRFKNLASTLSMARKAFRWAKSVNFYVKISKLIKKGGDPVVMITGIGKALGYFLYLIFDSYVFLCKSKAVFEKNVKYYGNLCTKFWLMALLFGITQDLYKLYFNTLKLQKVLSDYRADCKKVKGDGVEVEMARKAVRDVGQAQKSIILATLKDAFDLPVPFNLLGYGGSACPSARTAGFTGFLSSCVGAYIVWDGTN